MEREKHLMKLVRYFLLVMLIIPISPISAADILGRDTLYQVSTIDALMAGLYDGKVSIGELKKRGDFGLGTFDKLDGEMIVLEGTVYQVTSDGLVHRVAKDETTPFAAVTFFDKDESAVIGSEKSFAELKDYLDQLLCSKNLFYAVKIEGTFKRVKTRSVPMQNKPYKKLVDITAHQPVFEFNDVKGTMIALRCPYFVQGLNVPGYHFHFLTSDRKRGGHVLDCTIERGVAMLDVTPEFSLFLPKDEAFYRMDFETDVQNNLERIE
jgi:acetolactate decarboxylase